MELILAVNPGSSSREYALYSKGEPLINAYYEHNGVDYLLTVDIAGESSSNSISAEDFESALSHFIALCTEHKILGGESTIVGAGIRVVVPGSRFLKHQLLTEDLHDYLKQKVDNSPLHMKVELDQIQQIQASLTEVPIFIISDSEFHKTLSLQARHYAIPQDDADTHDIYRFGYHGLSVQSVVQILKEDLSLEYEKVIVCHLGSGSSITALKNWQSIDTSMGYSPLEGLVMATRSGNIDIEAGMELKRKLNLDDKQLIDYLNKQSGLLGLSKTSNDIRELIKAEESGDENAKFALDAMVYRIQAYIGSYHAILGGIDAIVFTATVGERSSIMRGRICEAVAHLGVDLDDTLNADTDSTPTVISKSASKITVHVIPSNEPAEIARQTAELLGK